QDRLRPLKRFQPLSYGIGLTYLVISLWLPSVSGTSSDWDNWASVRQWNRSYWGLLSTAVSAGLAWYGLKNKDAVAREFGIVFFIINLYTRFFEYLWDNLNRAVFFLILALSFWFVGRWAERRWNRDKSKAE